MSLRTFAALVGTPGIALGVQSVMYALVTPSCARQDRFWLHGSAALALAAAVVLVLLAWQEWNARASGGGPSPDSDARGAQDTRRFLAAVATAVAALSSLVILMMWVGAWVLSPCSEL